MLAAKRHTYHQNSIPSFGVGLLPKEAQLLADVARLFLRRWNLKLACAQLLQHIDGQGNLALIQGPPLHHHIWGRHVAWSAQNSKSAIWSFVALLQNLLQKLVIVRSLSSVRQDTKKPYEHPPWPTLVNHTFRIKETQKLLQAPVTPWVCTVKGSTQVCLVKHFVNYIWVPRTQGTRT